MSTYKFMSGIVDSLNSGASMSNNEFDPHEHRVIHHPTSLLPCMAGFKYALIYGSSRYICYVSGLWWLNNTDPFFAYVCRYLDTMTHLLKASIGAGILAMPHATKGMGIMYSAITLILIGAFATYCMQSLIAAQYELCKRQRQGYIAYPKSMRLAIKDGPPCMQWSASFFYWGVESTLVIWQFGICTIFLVFVAENVKQILDFYGMPISLRLFILYLLPPTIILNLVKDLKMLSPLSSISNVVTILGILLVFFYLIEDDLVVTQDKLKLKNWQDIPTFVGTALFALEAVGVVLALEYNMENPKQFGGFCGLFNIGMTIIIGLYVTVGIFGYLKYGNEIKASITLNLPEKQKKAQTAKLLFAVAIFLSFPLQNFVAYNFVWRRVKKKFKNGECLLDYTTRVFCVIVPWSLAIALPRLGPFICLFGALCLSLLAIVFPAIMSLCINYNNDVSGYGPGRYKLIRDIIIIVLGINILVSGVFCSILEIIQ